MEESKKFHLYYDNKKVNNRKGNIIAWQRYSTGRDEEDESEEPENKDYSFMKEGFKNDLSKLENHFNSRYSEKNILLRNKLKIDTKVYLKINTYKRDKLTGAKTLFKSLGMKVISFDETFAEYIVELSIEEYNNLVNIIKNFISRKENKFVSTENLLKNFVNFSLLSQYERISDYYNYTKNGGKIYVELFESGNLEKIRNSLLILNPNLNIIIENNIIIIDTGKLIYEDINTIGDCFDSIKKVSASNINFKVGKDGNLIKEDYIPSIDNSVKLDDIICVIDSGIDSTTILKDYIEYNKDYNLSHIGLNPLEDSKKGNGHGTNVAGVIIFGNQLHEKKKNITPICKVCSLQIIGPDKETPISYLELIKDIEKIHKNSGGAIKIFNLSISTECLKNNEISKFSSWLDNLMHRYDILCIICAGNYEECETYDYPMGWLQKDSNITVPADSINGITVGSIECKHKGKNYVSHYSRKDNIEYPRNFSETSKRYRVKPDILSFGGHKDNEVHTIGPGNVVVDCHGTSFSTPYVTHLLLILKRFYKDISMNSLKGLLLNRTESVEFSKEFYKTYGVDYRKIYGNGIIPIEKVTTGDFALSNDNKVTILIESSFDFSNYDYQKYPFLTTNIKMPELKVKRGEHVKLRATLCYNPLVNLTDNLGDYNTCFLGFRFHYGNDDFNTPEDGITDLKYLKGKRWSCKSSLSSFWNNTQIESFTLTKNEYNKLVNDGMAITIKAVLKRNKDIEEWYKENKQNFSLIITVEDEGNEGKLYDFIKNENGLDNIVENSEKLKA